LRQGPTQSCRPSESIGEDPCCRYNYQSSVVEQNAIPRKMRVRSGWENVHAFSAVSVVRGCTGELSTVEVTVKVPPYDSPCFLTWLTPKRDNPPNETYAFVRALLLPLPNYTQTRNSLYKSICPFPNQVLVKLKSLYKKLYKTLNRALSHRFAKPPAFAHYPILPLRIALLGVSLDTWLIKRYCILIRRIKLSNRYINISPRALR
jgi:hypothetical protein